MSSGITSVSQINSQVIDPKVVRTEGAGKAFQSVANSMAITVQDATDYLRTNLMVSAAVSAVCLEKMAENPYVNVAIYSPVLAKAQQNVATATENFTKVGMAAGNVLKNFPSS
jgi:cytidylate kinase